MWSLPFEVQMYIALPLLFLITTTKRSVYKILLTWVLASVVCSALQRFASPFAAGLVQYSPCFLAGVLSYALQDKRKRILPPSAWIVFVVGVLTGSILVLSFAVPAKLAINWCICFLLGVAIPYFQEITSKWLRLTSHTIAQYSFGIYLLHGPAMWISFKVLPIRTAGRWAALAILSVGLPAIAYHVIELPAIEAGRTLAQRLFCTTQPTVPASDHMSIAAVAVFSNAHRVPCAEESRENLPKPELV
jgi:peptidoglycan/LPS O-acetylase OafA/YrhL